MPTTNQKADLLFKKFLNKGSSNVGEYYNELLSGRPSITPDQIWAKADQIPIPSVQSNVALVDYIQDLELIPVPGAIGSFYSPLLRESIPFNFDPSGSYVPTFKKNDGTQIVFGQNDWVLDTDIGQVTFYSGLPTGVSSTVPPKMTFWRYVGPKGALSGAQSKDFISGQIDTPSVDNHYYLINESPVSLSILSLNIALWGGTGQASIIVDSTPVPGLSNINLTGMDTITHASSSGYFVGVGSTVILEMSNMSVNAGRTRYTLTILKSLE